MRHLHLSARPAHRSSLMAEAAAAPDPNANKRWWFQRLNRYHWYVFILCSMGWLFDTMDQKIFTISRQDAMKTFLPNADFQTLVAAGGNATTIFMLGWATGGLIFG